MTDLNEKRPNGIELVLIEILQTSGESGRPTRDPIVNRYPIVNRELSVNRELRVNQ